jgi:hypothetical protein
MVELTVCDAAVGGVDEVVETLGERQRADARPILIS